MYVDVHFNRVCVKNKNKKRNLHSCRQQCAFHTQLLHSSDGQCDTIINIFGVDIVLLISIEALLVCTVYINKSHYCICYKKVSAINFKYILYHKLVIKKYIFSFKLSLYKSKPLLILLSIIIIMHQLLT